MGFGGSAAAMIQSIRYNAKQLAKRNNYFEKDVASKYGTSTKIVDYKKMSPAQFVAFKQKLKQNEVSRQKRLTIVFGGVMVVILGVLIYFLFYH
ncbi:hypothetical protein [Aequorivita antarctica]|uniref:Uncharacterized protein n=1 Tax=Aequorivita antarctica TaxID=153266 RepID=A0A5C6Z1N1_9FLAO|nr:hypothetical protein [Aequorivita antarctica]TXD73419.1 hypothetical protein ESU54_06555 [Aequorivita antarctica]SRX76362.1 hypothetical protein AEQU3_03362 [Aequorivita antarctica]